MIVSYHPCFVAGNNRSCAGREPNEGDLEAIRIAEAVILPQGCYRSLYEMAKANCRHVFPDYDARFKYPGKTGQAVLFSSTGVSFPETFAFGKEDAFPKTGNENKLTLAFPFVFKFDWGGEGESVFLVHSQKELNPLLERVRSAGSTDEGGFVLQKIVPTGGRSLRVVVIGKTIVSYWRVSRRSDLFFTGVSSGSRIEKTAAPALQDAGRKAVSDFCAKTGINLAGFDLLFSTEENSPKPLFLEINYFFGRRGLGGSEEYYRILVSEIQAWLEGLGLSS